MESQDSSGNRPEIAHRLKRLHELVTEPRVPVGTRVYVEEDEREYIGVGHTTQEIAARLGWTQGNIWLPEREFRRIAMRHPVLPDPISAAEAIVSDPLSVHDNPRKVDSIYFNINADEMRHRNLLASQSAPYVDTVIELRRAGASIWLRMFHLSPAHRNKGGIELWP